MQIIPSHLSIIMDGNRRWAIKNGKTLKRGHQQGAENLRNIAFYAFSKGVKVLSVFAFSTENWQRTTEEVNHLMSLLVRGFDKYFDEFNKKGVKIVVLGDKSKLPKKVKNSIENAEAKSKNNKNGTIAICFNYGGRQEIIQAIDKLIKVNEKQTINEQNFSKYLYGGSEIPDIDLLIRTSGEKRISNYMIWRAAYSELYFTDTLWPDFDHNELDLALKEYNIRQRRYGV